MKHEKKGMRLISYKFSFEGYENPTLVAQMTISCDISILNSKHHNS